MTRPAFLLVFVAFACMPPRSSEESDKRQDCLDAAEAHSNERAAEECPNAWDTCAKRAEIMAELTAAQKDCR